MAQTAGEAAARRAGKRLPGTARWHERCTERRARIERRVQSRKPTMRFQNVIATAIVLLAAPLARAEDAKSGPALPPMQQQMQEMQRSIDQLRETADPAKRRMLMGQHMAQMR